VSLSDIMSHAGLVAFAEVGLVVSFVAFTALVVWVMLRPRDEMDAEARKPLDADQKDEPGRG
jgi:cbb3-type cytochrome oxidase subunit 3